MCVIIRRCKEIKVGLYDADGHNFPSLPLMKLSAYHKTQGDKVEFVIPLMRYDRIYISRVFGDDYTIFNDLCLQADEIIYGGTGFAIKIENGKEVYRKVHSKLRGIRYCGFGRYS